MKYKINGKEIGTLLTEPSNLILIKRLGKIKKPKDRKEYSLYRCKLCSNEKVMREQSAVCAKSCGCLIGKVARQTHTTHGLSNTRVKRIYYNILDRCNNPKNKCYKNYGGRGIKVCPEWCNIQIFWNDMKNGYAGNLTLDRVDNNKGYSKENCRWSTRLEQQNNTRKNVSLTYEGETLNLAQWGRKLNVKYSTMVGRHYKYKHLNRSYNSIFYPQVKDITKNHKDLLNTIWGVESK